jgi:universal stress protein F
MIRSILVALDRSVRAAHVLAVATDLANHYDARLVLMRAITIPPDFAPGAHVTHPDGLETFLGNEARTEVEQLASAVHLLRVEKVVVTVGEPWRAILDVAERSSADLIVIGSHGYTGLDRLLGTTAAKVVNHARRNVFVVHEASRA